MQIYVPVEMPDFDTSLWVRKRMNHKQYMLTGKPIDLAIAAGYDAWAGSGPYGYVHQTNPVWNAATKETDRLLDLYNRLVFTTKALDESLAKVNEVIDVEDRKRGYSVVDGVMYIDEEGN